MRSFYRAAVASLGLGILVALGGYRILAPTNPPAAFTGEKECDFGKQMLVGTDLTLSHRFALTNTSGHNIHITHVESTCGCTSAKAEKTEVGPGETLAINTTLSTQVAKRKVEQVFIAMEGDGIDGVGVEKLVLKAEVIRAQELAVSHHSLRLPTGGSARVLLVVKDLDNDDEPPLPLVVAPGGVTVGFDGWVLDFPRDPSSGRSARWHGGLNVELATNGLKPDAVLAISLPNGKAINIGMQKIGSQVSSTSQTE